MTDFTVPKPIVRLLVRSQLSLLAAVKRNADPELELTVGSVPYSSLAHSTTDERAAVTDSIFYKGENSVLSWDKSVCIFSYIRETRLYVLFYFWYIEKGPTALVIQFLVYLPGAEVLMQQEVLQEV